MATSTFYNASGAETSFNLPPDYESSGHAKVVTADDVVTLTPTIDTAAYADGDTLFDAAAVTLIRVAGRPVTLQSVAVTDKDAEGATIDLFFFDASLTFGTINVAPSISDADALKYLGHVRISAADYVTVNGAKVANIRGIGLLLDAASGTSIYVAGVIREAKTYTAATDLQFRFGVYQS